MRLNLSLPLPFRHKKLHRHLPRVLSLLLLVGLIASVAYWANAFLSLNRQQAEQEPATIAEADLSQAAALFGEEASMGASQYQLLGIVVGKRPEDGIAILGEEGKPGKPVPVGQEIASGVSVKEVGPGYAVLSDNGRSIRLLLPERAAKQAAQEARRRNEEDED